MLRHVIAPARSYAQIPNVIIRHPRLSSDAKTLLTWQLSLPRDARQCLSSTAEKAGIKKTAFQRAKRQLLDERYFHEWRVQRGDGRFTTIQLVSNAPLGTKEALAVRDGLRPTPGDARLTTDTCQQPTAADPAPGEPTGRPVGHQPPTHSMENTTQPTPAPAKSASVEPVGGRAPDHNAEPHRAPTEDRTTPQGTTSAPAPTTEDHTAAANFLRSLVHLDSRLAMPDSTARRWAHLATPWLNTTGLTRDQVRHTLTHGLDGARSPLGALRWRLEYALPDIPPPTPATSRPEPRVARMRECEGSHTQPRLFTPPPDTEERLCPACRDTHATASTATSLGANSADSGYRQYLAARQRTRHSALSNRT